MARTSTPATMPESLLLRPALRRPSASVSAASGFLVAASGSTRNSPARTRGASQPWTERGGASGRSLGQCRRLHARALIDQPAGLEHIEDVPVVRVPLDL